MHPLVSQNYVLSPGKGSTVLRREGARALDLLSTYAALICGVELSNSCSLVSESVVAVTMTYCHRELGSNHLSEGLSLASDFCLRQE